MFCYLVPHVFPHFTTILFVKRLPQIIHPLTSCLLRTKKIWAASVFQLQSKIISKPGKCKQKRKIYKLRKIKVLSYIILLSDISNNYYSARNCYYRYYTLLVCKCVTEHVLNFPLIQDVHFLLNHQTTEITMMNTLFFSSSQLQAMLRYKRARDTNMTHRRLVAQNELSILCLWIFIKQYFLVSYLPSILVRFTGR